MNTSFNRRHHLNRQCVVLSWDCSMHYVNLTKNLNIPHVSVYATKWMATGANQTVELRILRLSSPIWVSRQAFPTKMWEGCLKHMDTAMLHMLPHCCIHIRIRMLHIWNLSFRHSMALTASFASWIRYL